MKLEGGWMLDVPLESIGPAAQALQELRPTIEFIEELLHCQITLFFDPERGA